jgi:hypothetical protein
VPRIPVWRTESIAAALDRHLFRHLDNFFSYLRSTVRDSSTLRFVGRRRHGGLNQPAQTF